MAAFNPDIPDANVPNFFRYSEPISNVKPDVSTGMALSTIGEGIEGATKLADATVKQSINADVRAMAEKERSQFTSALETVRNGIIPAPVQTPSGGQVLGFADEAQGQAAPAAIDAGIAKIGAAQAALASGKVNDTYYTQQLNAGVKRLRAQYPGYVDYIDSEVSKITGINPANAYMNNLMQDINRSQTNKKTEQDKDLDQLRRLNAEGVPNADKIFNKLQADPSFAPAARTWMNEQGQKLYIPKVNDAQRADFRGQKQDLATQRTEDFTRETGAAIDNAFHTQTTLTGTNTPQGIQDFVAAVARGDKKATDAQMEQLATLLLTQKNNLSAQLTARSNQLIDDGHGGKVSYASDIGTQKRDEIIKSQLGIYDLVIDSIKNKDMGAAYSHMNHARGLLDTTKSQIVDSDIGSYVAKSKAFLDTMGPNWTNLSVTEGLRKNMDVKSRAVFEDNALDARLQPNLAATGVPTAVTDHMDAVKKKMTAAQRAVHYDNLLDLVNDLRNPNAPDVDKSNIVRYFYSPEAQGLLKNFKMDYTTPDGKPVPGKYAVWTRLTTPDITDQLAKMSKSDQAAGTMYRNWVENTGRELIGEDVRNLNHFTGHDNLTFGWDSKNKQILFDPNQGNPVGKDSRTTTTRPPPDSYVWQIQKIVNRVNLGLYNLSHVQDSFGGDTEAYVLNMLQNYGLDFNGKITGLPKAIGDAIAASRKPQQRMEDTFKEFK